MKKLLLLILSLVGTGALFAAEEELNAQDAQFEEALANISAAHGEQRAALVDHYIAVARDIYDRIALYRFAEMHDAVGRLVREGVHAAIHRGDFSEAIDICKAAEMEDAVDALLAEYVPRFVAAGKLDEVALLYYNAGREEDMRRFVGEHTARLLREGDVLKAISLYRAAMMNDEAERVIANGIRDAQAQGKYYLAAELAFRQNHPDRVLLIDSITRIKNAADEQGEEALSVRLQELLNAIGDAVDEEALDAVLEAFDDSIPQGIDELPDNDEMTEHPFAFAGETNRELKHRMSLERRLAPRPDGHVR